MNNKKLVYNFLNSQKHAVVASVDLKGNPQAATVGYGQTESLEIIFGTSSLTRKADNLSQNNHVALVTNSPTESVQYEGTAKMLVGQDLTKYTKIFFKKMPNMEKYALLKNQIYYLVKPSWIRFIDHTKSPNGVLEIKF